MELLDSSCVEPWARVCLGRRGTKLQADIRVGIVISAATSRWRAAIPAIRLRSRESPRSCASGWCLHGKVEGHG